MDWEKDLQPVANFEDKKRAAIFWTHGTFLAS